mmetsp:Transcript_80333/g.227506  ORF Transcript_80333/g.227506 Transcript_80333/m.227506 type:complete len:559 (+) Transcript_80333:719-2395(+)
MSHYRAQELSNTAWACAALAFTDEPLLSAISSAALASLGDFITQHLANTVWAYAIMICRHEPLLHAIAAAALATSSEFHAQSLSNTAWSLARLAVRDPPLLESLSAESIPKISDFTAQELSNTALAFSTLEVSDQPLLQSISSSALATIGEFVEQELSNTAWAVAKLGFRHTPCMDALAAESIRTMSALTPHDLSGTAWAFATLSYSDHMPLLDAISAASLPPLSDFNSQDLANTAWAFATICFKNPESLGSQTAEVMGKITEFAPQGLATTAWAYSSLNVTDTALLAALSEEVIKKLADIEPQSLGILADAKLACRESVERTLRPFADRFLEKLPASLDPGPAGAFVQFVRDLRIDNFGAWGTRYVLRQMNFPEPPPDFRQRAERAILKHASSGAAAGAEDRKSRTAASALSGTALVHRRVFSYAEYDLGSPTAGHGAAGGAVPLTGSITAENGRRESRERGAADDGALPLRALSSPISGLVNRNLCSEFQLMCAIMDTLQRADGGKSMASLRGTFRLFVSTAPCVSCIWALRQFQIFLPCACIEVANGEDAYLFAN